jgi:DNA transposition AAA+ family ATPase
MPASAADRLSLVIERLQTSRTALIIDEAHHLGPRALNLVKTLINQTPGEFVFLCLPSLWNRLAKDAYEEARQLSLNRMRERIHLDGISAADAVRFLERRVETLNGAAKDAAEIARQDAGRRGGFAWLAAVAREAVRLEAADTETFARAAARAAALRGVAR